MTTIKKQMLLMFGLDLICYVCATINLFSVGWVIASYVVGVFGACYLCITAYHIIQESSNITDNVITSVEGDGK